MGGREVFVWKGDRATSAISAFSFGVDNEEMNFVRRSTCCAAPAFDSSAVPVTTIWHFLAVDFS